MNVCFLLGAGVSQPAGMPKTEEITQAVLDTTRVSRHSSGQYIRNALFPTLPGPDANTLQGIRDLLPQLRNYCQGYFDEHEKDRLANYEDLHYVSAQLHDHLTFEYENPAMDEFAKLVRRRVRLPSGVGLAEVADELCGYIQDMVCSWLSGSPTRLDHLNCLVEAAGDKSVRCCNVFTLNHDQVIERVLDDKAVGFQDGFDRADGEVRWWDPQSLEGDAKIKLLKLHGSVDWYAYGRNRKTSFAKVESADPFHARDRRGRRLPLPSKGMRPLLLLGTFNKMLDYTGGLFADLFCLFRRILMQSRCLIVSGYSFRDKGVNRVLVEWLNRAPSHTMVVVHSDRQQLRTTARGALRNPWDELVGRGQLRFVESRFEDATWGTVRSLLLRSSPSRHVGDQG